MTQKKKSLIVAVAALLVLLLGAAGIVCLRKAAGMYNALDSRLADIEAANREILYNTESSEGRYEFDYSWLNENYLIAHAMGGIDGLDYTNCREAMELAYENGFRVFEGDFMYLEGHSVLAHDAEIFCEQAGIPVSELTYDSFTNAKLMGKYSPLMAEDVIDFLAEHPDAYFMTDSKYTENPYSSFVISDFVIKAMERDASVLDRVIVQIYNQAMLDEVMDIYPFRSVVYTLYQSGDTPADAMVFCCKSGIGAVTMKDSWASQEVMTLMDTVGLYVLTHTVNDADRIIEAFGQGVDAVYTDFVLPSMVS